MDDLWPAYRSHKLVHAVQIVEVYPRKENLDGQPLTVGIAGGGVVHLDGQVFARYLPQAGDYLVRYADGYLSISPAKAFDEGYTPDLGDIIVGETGIAARNPKNGLHIGWLTAAELRNTVLHMLAHCRPDWDASKLVIGAAALTAFVNSGTVVKADADRVGFGTS